ncbi:hypothetical protein PTMSG1_05222 [Pyrenophora teres f. maculata]|nr:hypothetical protein PTMSG1_05222 [Pyrenophora teres f. maculata]
MRFTFIASVFALASIGMASPTPEDGVKGLNKRGPCPAAGSGNIDPCCYRRGPDKNCRSESNCYTRCNYSGAIGCVAGKLSFQ